MKCLNLNDVVSVALVAGCVIWFANFGSSGNSLPEFCNNGTRLGDFRCRLGEKCCNRRQFNGQCVDIAKDCPPRLRRCGSDFRSHLRTPDRIGCFDTVECEGLSMSACDIGDMFGYEKTPHPDCEKCAWKEK